MIIKNTLRATAVLLLFFVTSCSVNRRSNIAANETFIINPVDTAAIQGSRGLLSANVLDALFMGINYLSEKSAKSFTNTYTHTISLKDYYKKGTDGKIQKTYNEILVQKFGRPFKTEEQKRLVDTIRQDMKHLSGSGARGATSTNANDIVRNTIVQSPDNLLNFHAAISLESDENDATITRLKLRDLRVFFSKTKVLQNDHLNALISVAIEGVTRSKDGSSRKVTIVEQEFDFRNIRYGSENQVLAPLYSPWYYDLPVPLDIDDSGSGGLITFKIQMTEYESGKSKYIKKIPGILSDNKNMIIKTGGSVFSSTSGGSSGGSGGAKQGGGKKL